MRLASACVLAAILLAPTFAGAAPPASPPPLADALTGTAKEAYGAAKLLAGNHDFAGASVKFQQAYDASHDARLLYNLAVCAKELHHYAQMQSLLRRYEQESGPSMPADDRARADAALAAIASFVGRIHLLTDIDASTVAIDGETVGTTPIAQPLPVDLGKHTLTVQHEGFAPFTSTVDVSGGSDTEVKVTLTASVHAAHLVVQAAADATVTLDGKVVGTGRYDASVSPGAHGVQVSAPGKVPYKSDVELADGETRTMDVTLDPAHHGAVWPWVVGGAVVAAAGAAVGGYFLFRTDSTTGLKPGTFGTGQVMFQSIRW